MLLAPPLQPWRKRRPEAAGLGMPRCGMKGITGID